jgi:hypothetical protein
MALEAQQNSAEQPQNDNHCHCCCGIAALVVIPYTKSHTRGGPIITLY